MRFTFDAASWCIQMQWFCQYYASSVWWHKTQVQNVIIMIIENRYRIRNAYTCCTEFLYFQRLTRLIPVACSMSHFYCSFVYCHFSIHLVVLLAANAISHSTTIRCVFCDAFNFRLKIQREKYCKQTLSGFCKDSQKNCDREIS